MKNIKNSIRIVVEKLILKKHPVIESIDSIEDVMEDLKDDYPNLLGKTYVINLNTTECLDSKTMELIDTEIKNLFRLLSVDSRNRFSSPTISTFFKCDDGLGFRFIGSYGYKHH
jgi:hypothetical protein